MPDYSWSKEKNEWLKEERGVSFEEVVEILKKERLLILIDIKIKNNIRINGFTLFKFEDMVTLFRL